MSESYGTGASDCTARQGSWNQQRHPPECFSPGQPIATSWLLVSPAGTARCSHGREPVDAGDSAIPKPRRGDMKLRPLGVIETFR